MSIEAVAWALNVKMPDAVAKFLHEAGLQRAKVHCRDPHGR